jgi:hypothetical protein
MSWQVLVLSAVLSGGSTRSALNVHRQTMTNIQRRPHVLPAATLPFEAFPDSIRSVHISSSLLMSQPIRPDPEMGGGGGPGASPVDSTCLREFLNYV